MLVEEIRERGLAPEDISQVLLEKHVTLITERKRIFLKKN